VLSREVNSASGWSPSDDGSLNPRNKSLCPGKHEVSVSDLNNCISTASYEVANTPPVRIDLGDGVSLCEGQTYELNAGSSWKSTQWSRSGKKFSSQAKILISQPGSYRLDVTDQNNCPATDYFVMQTSTNLLEAAILLSSEAVIGDTVVVVDVSWPLPEQITWAYPEEMVVISEGGEIVKGKFEDAGVYNISLSASLGTCHDVVTKSITILDTPREQDGSRLGAEEEFLKVFTLHPNPNTGSFDVEAEFNGESPITITIWNLVSTLLISKTSDAGSVSYNKHFDFASLSSGTYVCRLDYAGGYKTIRFIVN
jgi:hypothetical protein